MNKRMIIFDANEQSLQSRSCPLRIAGGTVNYVLAKFVLGANWQNFDEVISAWDNGFKKSYAQLDSACCCVVPADILEDRAVIKVNLVGIGMDSREVLTTYPVEALIVDACVPVDGEPYITESDI